MRSIKFRAWNETDRTMYDIGFHLEPTGEIIPHSQYWEELPVLTLMQFTGLHDVHGKEIYEGDVVRFNFKSNSPVYVCEWSQKDRGFLFNGWFMNDEDIEGCEIIGDIYSNTELIK